MNRLEERWGQLTDAEEAARDALSDSIGRVTDINISELNLATHRAISAYISALESQGLKIVPVKPTVRWHNENDELPPLGQNVFLLFEARESYYLICTAELLTGNKLYWQTSNGVKLTGRGKFWAVAGDLPLPDGFVRTEPDPNGYEYIRPAAMLNAVEE